MSMPQRGEALDRDKRASQTSDSVGSTLRNICVATAHKNVFPWQPFSRGCNNICIAEVVLFLVGPHCQQADPGQVCVEAVGRAVSRELTCPCVPRPLPQLPTYLPPCLPRSLLGLFIGVRFPATSLGDPLCPPGALVCWRPSSHSAPPPHLFPLSIQWLFQWLQAFLSKRLGSLCEYVP